MSEHTVMTPKPADHQIEHVFNAWDDALGAKDLDAAIALYHEDCTLESPLVCYLLGRGDGVVRGRTQLRDFVAKVFAHQPGDGRASGCCCATSTAADRAGSLLWRLSPGWWLSTAMGAVLNG